MALKPNWLKKFGRQAPPAPPPGEQLINELRELRRQLDGIQSYFEMESDEDLIDAAIYLKEALEARHRYLLKQAREQNAVAVALPIEAENRERWIN